MNNASKYFAKIGEMVCAYAEEIFITCGAGEDFGIQVMGDDVVIFGGLNRLGWSTYNGFHPDRSYCSPKFLKLFDENYDEKGNRKRG